MLKPGSTWRRTVRDSSVGMATSYGLDGPVIESRWGVIFSAPVQTSPGAHPASYTMGTGSFPGVKRPGRDADHPLPSSSEVKERVELYFYPPLGIRDLFWGDLYLYRYLYMTWKRQHMRMWAVFMRFMITSSDGLLCTRQLTFPVPWIAMNVLIYVATGRVTWWSCWCKECVRKLYDYLPF
jgi:hypothetical protein